MAFQWAGVQSPPIQGWRTDRTSTGLCRGAPARRDAPAGPARIYSRVGDKIPRPINALTISKTLFMAALKPPP